MFGALIVVSVTENLVFVIICSAILPCAFVTAFTTTLFSLSVITTDTFSKLLPTESVICRLKVDWSFIIVPVEMLWAAPMDWGRFAKHLALY